MRSSNTSLIRYEFLNVLKALSKVSLQSENNYTISEAQQIIKNIENFYFICIL